MMTKKLTELSYQDFARIVPEKIDTILLPVGTIEAHGCTNIGTDITIPEYICEKLAGRMNMLIAPTISYGVTRTLLPYPGSMTVSPESFEMYVTDALISLFHSGFRKVVIINGHGGHYEPLQNAAMKAWHETGGWTIVIHWWELCAPVTEKIFGQSGGHAAIDETAMVLAANPALVHAEQCKAVEPYLVARGTFIYPNPAPILLYRDGEGAPKFDTKMARRYANAVVNYLAEFINDVHKKWAKNLEAY